MTLTDTQCGNWGDEWDCRCYIFETRWNSEVIIDEADDWETVKAELDHQGLHYSEDGLGELHIDIDEFEDYLKTEDYI